MDYDPIKKTEYDECAIHGICSISSALSSMQEIILIYLETLAFYLLELENLGLSNKNIRRDVIDVFSALTTNVEYSQDSLNSVLSKIYEDLFQAKEIYNLVCKERNIPPKYLKSKMKISQQYNIAGVIRQGQKSVDKKNQIINEDLKKMLSLLLLILKSLCLYIVELQELNVDIDQDYKELIFILDRMHFDNINDEVIDEIIRKSVKLDHELMKKTFDARKNEFGSIMPTEVSVSTRPGKAILVAGANMKELELILKATQDKGIDVYTHGQMIVGHTFPKLKVYPHLIGHYGKGLEHCIADFSSFPGVIYLTKLALYEIGHLCRSRIYTGDKIAQNGVIAIKDYNFEPLIQSALSAEGFTESDIKENIKIGLVEEEFLQRVNNLANKIESKKIKHLIAIGVSNQTETQKQYFEKFLELVGDDCFVVSASYRNNRENILTVDLDYVFPFSYKTIKIFKERGIFDDLNTTIFYTHCEPHTVPNLFMMRAVGIKNIYFDSCPPNLVNPALIDALRERLDIKEYTTPQEDIKKILASNK